MLKRKILSIVLAVLMLLSMLSGCLPARQIDSLSPSNPTTVPVPTRYDPLAMPSEITETGIAVFYARARIAQSADTQLFLFGAFDSIYAVLVRDTANPGEPYWETVNGLTFYYPDGYGILWENQDSGDRIRGRLWENFALQNITPEQLQVIYDNYYSAYPELLPLAQRAKSFGTDTMEAISHALLLPTGEELGWNETNTSGNTRLVYYCTVEGMHVFRWIDHVHSPTYDMKDVYVGPYHFECTEHFELYVYVDNELMTLAEAYDRELFTNAQIEVIYRHHNYLWSPGYRVS